MTGRAYARLLIGAAGTLFLFVVATNLLLDPQGIYRDGPHEPSPTVNDRASRFWRYAAAPDRYEGLLLGSSRGASVPLDELSRRFGGIAFAQFSVYGGLMTDHMAVLDFVLREKTERGRRLRAAFLLLDADGFGTRPLTNRLLQYTWPPPMTGEPPGRFWWRNLTAVQPRAWAFSVRRRIGAAPGRAGADGARDGATGRPPRAAGAQRVTARQDFARQLAVLERFVATCRRHGVRLVVAVSPLRRDNAANYDPTDLARAVDRFAAITPLWDFALTPSATAQRPDMWFDPSHFRPELGRLILDRIFDDASTAVPDGFGIHRGEPATATSPARGHRRS